MTNTQAPTTTTSWTVKTILVLAVLLTLLLLLVDSYPHIIIGFMLLILVGVILTHADIIASFLNV